MYSFDDLDINKQLRYALADLQFKYPTPIQIESFSVIRSGKDMLGVAQTGTGKTLAYLLPLLNDLTYSTQKNPRILILVPTRELVIQVVEQIDAYGKYINLRAIGVYGGTNINTQRDRIEPGMDILVATPGRLYDLVLSASVKLKSVKKLVIDEVDVMLDLGFRHQLTNLLELMPERKQSVMFSATMTKEVDEIIEEYFISPQKISIEVSGTPLGNIEQFAYPVQNFHTKANLLKHLIRNKEEFTKVLVFMPSKRGADILYGLMEDEFGSETGVIHSNKSQNYRIRSVEQFDRGKNRILIATDVIARGLDLTKVSHVINFDIPEYPENYMHRIGRTGRAEEKGIAISFFTENEVLNLVKIEELMRLKPERLVFPEEVEVSTELTFEERPPEEGATLQARNLKKKILPGGTHAKKAKNLKVNLGGSYKSKPSKYKKPKTKGDKKQNLKNKKKR